MGELPLKLKELWGAETRKEFRAKYFIPRNRLAIRLRLRMICGRKSFGAIPFLHIVLFGGHRPTGVIRLFPLQLLIQILFQDQALSLLVD